MILQTYRLKIDVTKIDKELLFVGKKGKYLDASLLIYDEPDEYGNNAAITQDLPKERREKGEKAKFIGNGKLTYDAKSKAKAQAPPKPAECVNDWNNEADADIPF